MTRRFTLSSGLIVIFPGWKFCVSGFFIPKTITWNLSGLTPMWLFSNQDRVDVASLSSDLVSDSAFFAALLRVLSSAYPYS